MLDIGCYIAKLLYKTPNWVFVYKREDGSKMLSSELLHLTIGLVFGVIGTVFTLRAANLLKQNNAAIKLLKHLAIFSLFIAILVFIYASIESVGLLVSWKDLGQPGGDRAVKIVDIGYIQTQSGIIYHFTDMGPYEGYWKQVDTVTKKEEIPSSPPNNCGTLSFLPILHKDFIDTKIACVTMPGPGIYKVAYAINDDGRVYLWQKGHGEFHEFIPLVDGFAGGVISCVSGTIIIALLSVLSFLKRKFQPRVSQPE